MRGKADEYPCKCIDLDLDISNHLEQAALEEEVERLALDDESSDDGLGGSNEDDSE